VNRVEEIWTCGEYREVGGYMTRRVGDSVGAEGVNHAAGGCCDPVDRAMAR
jgi:hypothetical protein